MRRQRTNLKFRQRAMRSRGFTLIEVMLAGSIMIILCVGTLTVFSHAVRINSGNNLRSQAQSVLQQEIEYYRSLKFVPGAETSADLDNHRSTDLRAGTISRPQRTAADGQVFNISVIVSNIGYKGGLATEEASILKEIKVTAVPATPEPSRPGWLSDANLRTNITFQRVRAN